MSITFSINGNAPMVKVFCDVRWPGLPADEFSYGGFEQDADGRWYFFEPAWVDANFSNSNAKALLRLLGIEMDPEDCCGHIDFEGLPALRRTILGMLNGDVPTLREPVAIDPQPRLAITSLDGGTERVIQESCCGYYDAGLDSAGVRQRLEALLQVIVEAQNKGLGICWG